jgi:hypothetical protein
MAVVHRKTKPGLFALLCGALFVTACSPQNETSRMTADTKPELHELWMERFNGLEVYRIESAKWNLYKDADLGRMNLWLSVVGGGAIKQFEDTASVGGQPRWELNLVETELADPALKPGFRASIPKGHDDERAGWITNFYFSSHDGSDNNTIEVLQRDGDRLLIRVTGAIVDVNYYDDSKPRSKLLVETWFEKDSKGQRSMQ